MATKARLLGNLISQGQPLLEGFVTQQYVDNKITQVVGAAPEALDTLKEIADQLANDQSAISAITNTLAGKANTSNLSAVATSGSYADLTNKPTLFSGSYADLTNKPTLFSGSYADLTNKPVGLATETYVNTAINNLVDSAPSALNTLNELAIALNNDASFASTITTALSLKANISSLATVATSGNYADLTNKPTTLSGYGITDGFTLPSQTGNTGKILTTNGTTASWQPPSVTVGKSIAMAMIFGA